MKFNKSFLIILITLLVLVGVESFISYIGNHNYYAGMLFAGKNIALIITAFACGFLPLRYLHTSNKPQLLPLLIRIGAGLGLFSVIHMLLSKALLSVWAIIPLLFNTLLLYTMSLLIIGLLLILGNWIVKKSRLFDTLGWWELLLSFGIGLVVFLVGIQVIMGLGWFQGWLLWGVVGAMLGLGWWQRKHLLNAQQSFDPHLASLQQLLKGKWAWIVIILILASFAYYFFGFVHSYIPYPTAWDANHEYMYIPKVIAESGGILRGNTGPADGMPYLWHWFIAFCFAIWQPLTAVLNISADTFAINMNIISGILVLLFGLAVIREVLCYFADERESKENEEKNLIAFFVGRGLLLLWLTSGMGAFLLFVDNKTDMGVLSLVVMALLAGWKFLNHHKTSSLNKTYKGQRSKILLILSAVFFAFAVMAKPTAFIDVVVYGLVLLGIGINGVTALGAGIGMLGVLGIIQPLFTSAFLTPVQGKILLGIGIVLVLIGVGLALWRKAGKAIKRIGTISLWGAILLLSIIIFKAPRVAIKQSYSQNLELKPLLQATLLGHSERRWKEAPHHQKHQHSERFLLAQSSNLATLNAQEATDLAQLDKLSHRLSFAQCQVQSFDSKELSHGLQSAPGNTTNEDFGRYVGFGAREFPKTGLGGIVLKLLFRNTTGCYGRDTDGLLLCQHREAIKHQHLDQLEQLALTLRKQQLANTLLDKENSPALQLLTTLLEQAKQGHDLRDAYKALETYYQEHSIVSSEKSVMIPYRYIVPFNAIFNRSLQNHSSYYTDIGLIWLFVLMLLIGTVLYAILMRYWQLLWVSIAVVIGWGIWWTIAAGIVWYGLGLIVWSITISSLLWQQLHQDDKAQKNTELFARTLALFGLYCGLQAAFNFARIASQASDGPFAWYRSNVGNEQVWSDQGTFVEKVSYKYGADQVFGLQFGQYLPFLQYVAERNNSEGILIAGTYIQYFLHNHHNIRMDGLLNWLWEQFSDFNSCKSYHRLKQQQVKYLVIDPNIGTVGRAGQGNESLFHRFFAKLDAQESSIQIPGAMTMLTKFAQEGYLKLIFTNNIGAKYAFSLSDETLREALGNLSQEELVLLRAKLAVAKFFITEQDFSLLQTIFSLFQSRLIGAEGLKAEGIEDVANILQRAVDGEKLIKYAESFFNGKLPDMSSLSLDEKLVLVQYLGLVRTLSNEPSEGVLIQFLQNSIFGSSQIITLELQ